MIGILKMLICFVMGAGFGWFTSCEWQKHYKKEQCDWKAAEPVKKTVTTADIRVLDWTVKTCK